MSWQATAWAEKQVTGSPSRKVLLLVLSQYADENGRCWPSQRTLAAGCEQSTDTVQRNLKRLAADGFICMEKRQRFGGHWPAYEYQLMMPPIVVTGPQNAARSQSIDARTGEHRAAKCGTAEPHQSRKPSRTAMRYEYLYNSHPNNHHEPDGAESNAEGPKATKRSRCEIQDLQHRIVEKLGDGHLESGWLIFGGMPTHERKMLEDLEARHALTPEVIAAVRARHSNQQQVE